MTQPLRQDQVVSSDGGTALGQMATRHRLAALAQADEVARGLRVAFGRMAQDLAGLEAQVLDLTITRVSLAEVADMLEPAMFVALLEGQGDRIGASLIAPALLAGLVEGAATGRVVSPPPAAPRAPTRTDAALVSPMIDALLHHARERSGPALDGVLQDGWVYGSFLADPRPLPLMLEDGIFHLIRFSIALGQGRVNGTWSILLPEPAGQAVRADLVPAGPSWSDLMEAAIHPCPTEFAVTLFRAQLSLDAALSLNAGDMLCIPMSALEVMTLETLDGRTLATGRLGQARGQRAMRLSTELGQADPDILAVPKARSLTPVIRAGQAMVQDAPPSLGAVQR